MAMSTAGQGQTPTSGVALSLEERTTLSDLVATMRARVRGPQGEQKRDATAAKLQKALEVKATVRAASGVVHDRAGQVEAHLLATGRYSM